MASLWPFKNLVGRFLMGMSYKLWQTFVPIDFWIKEAMPSSYPLFRRRVWFRSISLVGIIYKIISKLLVDRLKRIMHSISSGFHGAFANGRQTLDNVLIADESIDFILKEGSSSVLCKLDIVKMYDRVN